MSFGYILPLLLVSQIDISEVYDEHTLVEANCQCSIPEGASPVFFWSASPKVDFRPVDSGRRVLAVAPPGRHRHTISVNVLFIDWETRTTSQQSYSRSFYVKKKETPDPDDDDEEDEEDEDDRSDPPNRLVIVRDSDEQSPTLNALLDRLTDEGIASVPPNTDSKSYVLIFDPESAKSPTARLYIDAAKSLPYFFALRDRKVIKSGRLPDTYTEFEQALAP